jgi:CubicO group peptidase (beta-lactamase class C family)
MIRALSLGLLAIAPWMTTIVSAQLVSRNTRIACRAKITPAGAVALTTPCRRAKRLRLGLRPDVSPTPGIKLVEAKLSSLGKAPLAPMVHFSSARRPTRTSERRDSTVENELPQIEGEQSMYPCRLSVLFAAILVATSMEQVKPTRAAQFEPPEGATLSVEKLSGIDDFFKAEDATGRMPGAIVLVQRHGKPVYLKTFGKRDIDAGIPMTIDAIFPIHSVTKTITSVSALMLVDRGKIALDDPVSKYIPSFAGMKVGVERKDETGKAVLELAPPRRPVTIEDLLLHTSGITYGFYGEGLVKAAYNGIYLGDFDNAEFAERIAKVPLAEHPRTLWDYGHSIDVLGRVIEVASGQSLYQFEKENLLDPLGMTTTKFFLTDPTERARYAQPVDKDRHVERNSLDVTRWESGGGGMVSTISDFARYGQMLLNGGTLDGKTFLSPVTFKAMTTDHIGPESGVARNYFYYPGDGFGFGYGFGVRTDPGNAVPPPPGSLGEIKWDGATGVYLVVDRAQDMFFVLMQNSPSDRMHVLVNLKKIIYGAFEN